MGQASPPITDAELEGSIRSGQVIEDYPEDVRGHSMLVLGPGQDRNIHAVVTESEGDLFVITAYVPDPAKWEDERVRRTAQDWFFVDCIEVTADDLHESILDAWGITKGDNHE